MPIINRTGGGGAASKLPEFSCTGTYTLLDDGDGNWRIKFLTSGTLVLSKPISVDIFALGGGGGAVATVTGSYMHGLGGGGYTHTYSGVVIPAGTYSIVVGAGGAAGSRGNTSWAIAETQYYADGGYAGTKIPITTTGTTGGAGGSGGAGGNGGTGSTDGSNGVNVSYNGNYFYGGTGQGVTTREFGDAGGTLYATGGGTNATALQNTGNGGNDIGHAGMSGIVVIRNHRAA